MPIICYCATSDDLSEVGTLVPSCFWSQAFAPPFDLEHFTSEGNGNYQNSSISDHGGVVESKMAQSNTCERESRDHSDGHAVGGGFCNSPVVPTADVRKNPTISHGNDSRKDPRTSNKRLASERSHGNGRSSDEDSAEYPSNEIKQQSAVLDNGWSTSCDGVRIVENGELKDSDKSFQAKSPLSIPSENALVNSTTTFVSGPLNINSPPEIAHASGSDDMEVSYSRPP